MTFVKKLLQTGLTGLMMVTCLAQAQSAPGNEAKGNETTGNETAGNAANALVKTDGKKTAWEVETIAISNRKLQNGEPATLGIAVRLPPGDVPLRQIVLYLSSLPTPLLKAASGSVVLNNSIPWLHASAQLNALGIGVAFADAPSDTNRRQPSQRSQDIPSDLKQAQSYLVKKYPGIPIHLGVFSNNASFVLDAQDGLSDVQKTIVVSGNFFNSRTANWRSVKHPVMFVAAPSAQCDLASFYETEYVARRNDFVLVKAGYPQQEKRLNCDDGSQHRLAGLDDAFAALVANWLNNEPIPDHIGYANPQTAWREQVVNYVADGKKLEMTLLLPEGPGPFPVMIFNHGDIEMDSDSIRYKRRFRDMIVAREFLYLGIAVAIPSRPGVGMSEGIYLLPSSRGDADASYKGRLHAQNIMPALDFLKTIPELDTKRMIITGQSAGGYSTMYIASQNPPGVIGAVNFSGGRTDSGGGMLSGPGYLNRTMVNGFEESGKTARMPVLMIFAENDSRYSANTIRVAYQAFVDAGGQASLSLTPPISIDGHFVYHQPQHWRVALRTYLEAIGAVQKEDRKPVAQAAVSN